MTALIAVGLPLHGYDLLLKNGRGMKQGTMVFAAIPTMAQAHPVRRALRRERYSTTEAAS